MPETLLFEKDNGVALITLNRPERLNVYNDQMGLELLAALREVEQDESVRVLLLTGAGNAFCAGGDLKVEKIGKLLGLDDAEPVRATDIHSGYRRIVKKIILGIHSLDIPTIAALPGAAVGVGCDMTLACDIRIGSEKARFRESWVNIGTIPAGGGTWLLPRLVGLGLAAEIIYSGRFVEAEEARRIGLLNRIVPAAELADQAMALALSIAKQPPVALKLSKISLYKGLSIDLATALELTGASQSIAVTTRDHEEAMAAFREKREGTFAGR